MRNPTTDNKICATVDGFSPSLLNSPLLEQSFKGFCFLKRIQSLTGSSESPIGKMNEAGHKNGAMSSPDNANLTKVFFCQEVKGSGGDALAPSQHRFCPLCMPRLNRPL